MNTPIIMIKLLAYQIIYILTCSSCAGLYSRHQAQNRAGLTPGLIAGIVPLLLALRKNRSFAMVVPVPIP